MGHSFGANARPDGYTLTMGTFELSTMHWMGISDLTYADYRPLMQVNADAAAIIVRQDAPGRRSMSSSRTSRLNRARCRCLAQRQAVPGTWHERAFSWLRICRWMRCFGFQPQVQLPPWWS